jgi:hypothetical protein
MTVKRILFINAIALISIGAFSSCKKEGCTDSTATNYNPSATSDDGSCITEDPTPSASTPSGYTPSFSGTFATLVGIKALSTTSTPIGPVDTEIGTAVAVFSEDAGANFIGAGTVSVDGTNLAAQSNNSYVYTPGAANPMGISFGGTQSWAGSGAAWPAFNASTTVGFPNVAVISSGNVTMASDYTLNCGSPVTADSIYFAVYGPNGTAMKVVAGGASSYTFTSAELSGVGAGSGFVQIVGINYDLQGIGGRDYYLLNETARTKSVTIN